MMCLQCSSCSCSCFSCCCCVPGRTTRSCLCHSQTCQSTSSQPQSLWDCVYDITTLPVSTTTATLTMKMLSMLTMKWSVISFSTLQLNFSTIHILPPLPSLPLTFATLSTLSVLSGVFSWYVDCYVLYGKNSLYAFIPLFYDNSLTVNTV